ncbi:MAG: class I SAM-dependent methyltransferase [Thermomicrobiales bacterium]|nr:class I SAM-dependent methyltransferase [Thermomicrobiales bacterium]
MALEEGAQLLGGVLVGFVTLRGIAHRRYLGNPLVDLPVGQREEELLLACEVRVERANGVAGLGGNLVNRGAVVAATGKDRQIDMRVADATSLPFPDESFDTVVCTYGLCTIPDDAAAVREAMRVLRPGGRILSPSMSAVRTPSCGPSSGLPNRSPIALAATTCCASHSITSGQRASRSTS